MRVQQQNVNRVGRKQREQAPTSAAVIAITTAVAAGVMIVVRVVHGITDIPTRAMTSDPTAVLDGPFYSGFVAVLGYAAWIAAAATLLLTVSVTGVRRRSTSALLRTLGILSLVLFVDDAFLLHEVVIPTYLGLPEIVTYAAYATAVLGLAARFALPVWRDPHRAVLIAAVGCLGASVLADQVEPLFSSWRFMEASAQLLGTFLWSAYAFSASRRELRARAATHAGRADDQQRGSRALAMAGAEARRAS